MLWEAAVLVWTAGCWFLVQDGLPAAPANDKLGTARNQQSGSYSIVYNIINDDI